MGKSQNFKHKTQKDAAHIADYLHQLAEGIENGTINFDNGVDQLVLRPEGIVDMKIESKTDGEKSKIEIEFKWSENQERKLSISTKEA